LKQGLIFNAKAYQYKKQTMVAIPLKQGLIFNTKNITMKNRLLSRNPFEAGTNFQSDELYRNLFDYLSQSL